VSWSSSVPAALAGLLATFQASPGLGAATPPVPVRDGHVVTGSQASTVVVVGWTGKDGDDTAVENTATTEGLAGNPDRERFQIRCAAMALNGGGSAGSGDLPAARTAAYALHAACGAAVAADRKLGGAVTRASMGDHVLHQDATQRGQRAIVEFMVQVDAYTGR
jgi:hypothetical protein